jgi:hypothetical protein
MARKNWVDRATETVLPAAFKRRLSPADDDGLSVDVDSAESCATALRECYGVASLHLGRIRDIGLDIVVGSPPHAVITGIPRDADDRTRAERIASELARQARLVTSQ